MRSMSSESPWLVSMVSQVRARSDDAVLRYVSPGSHSLMALRGGGEERVKEGREKGGEGERGEGERGGRGREERGREGERGGEGERGEGEGRERRRGGEGEGYLPKPMSCSLRASLPSHGLFQVVGQP